MAPTRPRANSNRLSQKLNPNGKSPATRVRSGLSAQQTAYLSCDAAPPASKQRSAARPCRQALLVVVAFAVSTQGECARAKASICSDPKRTGIRASGELRAPWTKLDDLENWLEVSSESAIGMNFASFATRGQKVVILHSPKASLTLHLLASRGRALVFLTRRRTCYSD